MEYNQTLTVSVLKQMAPAMNSQELQTFLGLATYIASIIPNLSCHNASLRELLKKENSHPFGILSMHQEVFKKIKRSFAERDSVASRRISKRLRSHSHARRQASSICQQSSRVKICKHRTETFSCRLRLQKVLQKYLYGRSFTVQSDHKSLESIHLKHLMAAPPRPQRMLMRLQPCDLTIKYRQGKYMKVADALSRLPPQPNTDV